MKLPAMNLEVLRTTPLMQKVASVVLVLAGIEQVTGFEAKKKQCEDTTRVNDYCTDMNLQESRSAVERQVSLFQFKLGFRLKG
jgi:hypothetical protein